MLARAIRERFGPATARAYVWVVNTCGIAVIGLATLSVLLSPVEPMALAIAVLVALSGISVLRLGSDSARFCLSDAFAFAGLFMYGPQFGALAVALGTIATSAQLGEVPHRLMFNTAVPALAMWLAGTTVFTIAGLPLPAQATAVASTIVPGVLAVALFVLIDNGLVAAAVGSQRRIPGRQIWRERVTGLWMGPAACGYIGWVVAVFTVAMGPFAVLALLPLPLIAFQMFRTSLARTADQVRHLEEMNRVHASTIEAFASAVDAKDQVTHGHLRRVQMYSLEIAGRLGIGDPGVLRAIEAAALLHDVGKIGVPEHILNKPGRLTPAEFEEMKRHVTIGADILSTVDFPFPVVPIVRHHHENWDGTGYPDGICGTDIPIGARILMVADCFDALTSDRPYRPAMTDAAAFEILRQRRGRMYDPEIVDLFLEVQPALARAGGLARPATARSHVTVPARAEARPQRAAGEGLTTVHAEALARLLSDLLTECLIVVYEVDATATAVVAKVAQGPGARHVIGHRLPLGHGVSGWVAVNRQPIDDTDALLDLSGVAPAIETALLTCTCTPVTTAAGDVVVTVYGPRAAANQRIAAVRSINMYLAAMARAGSRHGGRSESKPMAFAS